MKPGSEMVTDPTRRSKPLWRSFLVGACCWTLPHCAATRAFATGAFPPQTWSRDLPPRGTVIELDTDVGRFRLPADYLSNPYAAPDLTSHAGSSASRFRVGYPMFHFTMPDGTTNLARDGFIPGDDGGDRIGIDPRRFNVTVDKIVRAGDGQPSQVAPGLVAILSSDMASDSLHLLKAFGGGPTVKSYEGWTRSPSTGFRTSFVITCQSEPPIGSGICRISSYLEEQGLAIEGHIQTKHLDSVFDVVRKTSDLLNAWKIN